MPRDYYAILQINRRASSEEIERSYERLSKLYDPERSRKRRAPERWEQIQEAYGVLSDPAKRAEYDRQSAPSRIPGFRGGESAVTRFLTSRWGLPSLAAFIGAVVIAAVLVAVFSGDDDDSTAVLASPTGTPSPTPVTTPPPVEGEETTTESGLTIITIEEGTGDSPALGDTVVVDYTGWVEATGAKFDSSVDRGMPATFTLAEGGLIDGWLEGIPLMREGGSARLIIPSELGYGEMGNPPRIPPNADLIFDVDLLEVQPAGATPEPTASPEPSP